MNQTRLASLIEAAINTLIGFVIAYLAWPPAAWFFGIEYQHSQQFGIVLFFTVLSVARGYVVRRWFNRRLHALSVRLSEELNKQT